MSQDKLERAHYALELLDTAHAALLRLCHLDAPKSILHTLRTVDREREHLLGALGLGEPDLARAWMSCEPRAAETERPDLGLGDKSSARRPCLAPGRRV
jgi:hypothetical protein